MPLLIQGQLDNSVFVLWSVSVEEQFYLFVPWIVKYCNRKSLYGLCAVLVFASNGWLYHLGAERASLDRIWTDSLVQFQCFAAGILLFLGLRGRLPRIAVWKRLLLLAGSIFCWFLASYAQLSAVHVSSENLVSWSNIGVYVLAALGSVMMILAFLGLNLKLLPGWAVYLGRISFGLYVYHGMANSLLWDYTLPYLGHHITHTFILRICAIFGLTVLMAALSYRYFETPFLKIKRRHAIVESRPI